MSKFTKDQLLHLDIPEEFRGNFPSKSKSPHLSLDYILLIITIFYLIKDDK
ncbi:MAG: hypothetical protein GX366_02460 [Epulopiscium sp.]|nr:hypothetical protein [Candidatus Epulonipiscium sp.]